MSKVFAQLAHGSSGAWQQWCLSNIYTLVLVCRHQQQTGCDIVTGTRYKAHGGVCGWNFKRKLVSRGANFLAQTLLNPGVCAMKGNVYQGAPIVPHPQALDIGAACATFTLKCFHA